MQTLLKVHVTSSMKKVSKDSLHALSQVPEEGSGTVLVIQIVHRSSGLLATFGPGWRSLGVLWPY